MEVWNHPKVYLVLGELVQNLERDFLSVLKNGNGYIAVTVIGAEIGLGNVRKIKNNSPKTDT